jgi:hypothetical protein
MMHAHSFQQQDGTSSDEITARTLSQLLLDGWNQRPDPSGDGRVEEGGRGNASLRMAHQLGAGVEPTDHDRKPTE